MRTTFLKFMSLLPSKSISFSAKSAIIATTILSTGRAFAGGTTSGSGPFIVGGDELLAARAMRVQVELSQDQLAPLKALIDEKLSSPDLTQDTRIQLENLKEKLITNGIPDTN